MNTIARKRNSGNELFIGSLILIVIGTSAVTLYPLIPENGLLKSLIAILIIGALLYVRIIGVIKAKIGGSEKNVPPPGIEPRSKV